MDFVTIGDNKFFHTIDFSARQIKRFYPDSKLYIYDWGFTAEQAKKLSDNGNTEVIDWKDKLKFEDVRERFLNIELEANFDHKKDWKYYVKRYVLNDADFVATREKRIENRARREYLLCQKPKCFLDCAKYIKNGITFLDGDAFLVNKIDELLEEDFDIGVTLRRAGEIERAKVMNVIRNLNSGVIFFKLDSRRMQIFIERWLKLIEERNDSLLEQTALDILVQEIGDNIYDKLYNTGYLELDKEQRVKIKILPCEKYNYNWVESGYDIKNNKILHLKSGRMSKNRYIRRLKKELMLQDKGITDVFSK
ncbi:hypothetical protein ACFLWV_02260 [Chloroflexota bacterium]